MICNFYICINFYIFIQRDKRKLSYNKVSLDNMLGEDGRGEFDWALPEYMKVDNILNECLYNILKEKIIY